MGVSSRDASGAMVAVWRDLGSTKDQEVTIGSGGGPVTRLRHRYKSEAEARRSAEAAKARADRGEWALSLELPGRADIQAEARLSVVGLYPEADARTWLIRTVRHTVDSGGWRSSIEAELPGADEGDARA